MGMDALSCLSPDMAEKEIWVYLLAYNLIRLIMIESALLCDVIPRQLSFKHTIQLWLTFHQQTGAGNTELIWRFTQETFYKKTQGINEF